jgi:hypothetical protein
MGLIWSLFRSEQTGHTLESEFEITRGERTRYQGRGVAVWVVQVVRSVQYPPGHVLVYPGARSKHWRRIQEDRTEEDGQGVGGEQWSVSHTKGAKASRAPSGIPRWVAGTKGTKDAALEVPGISMRVPRSKGAMTSSRSLGVRSTVDVVLDGPDLGGLGPVQVGVLHWVTKA